MLNNIAAVVAEPKPTDDDRKMFVGGKRSSVRILMV